MIKKLLHVFLHLLQKRVFSLPAPLVLILSLGVSFLFSYLAYQRTLVDDATRFSRVEARFKDSIQNRFQVYINALVHTRSFINANPEMSRKSFRQFIEGSEIHKAYPGLMGISYVEKISAGQLKNHEAKVRSQGYPKYKVWPEGKRSEYTSIVIMEPFTEINQRAFGFDMMTESSRREAMEAARDSGQPSVTKKITLVQEQQKRALAEPLYSFIIYVPIYKIGMPTETIGQRRDALQGFVSGPFRARELFSHILAEEDFANDRVTFQIFDGEEVRSEEKVFQPPVRRTESPDFQGPLPAPRLVGLKIANRKWIAVLEPLPNFRIPSSRDTPWQIFLLGSVISAILYFFARYASQHAKAIARSERQIRLIADTLPVLISYIDRDDQYRFCNKAYAEWFGRNQNEIPGLTIEKVLGKEAALKTADYRRRTLRGETLSFELPLVHPTKGLRLVHRQYLPDVRPDGSVAGIVVLSTDITEQKKSEERLLEQSRILEVVNRVGLSLRGEMELEKIVQIVTDSAKELTNAKFGAFFYNVKNRKSESDSLYVVSGVPREEFSRFPMLRNTKIFDSTFVGKEVVRSGDITKHENFGKNPLYSRLLTGHLSVRSYIAVPVVSREGEVLGGLLLGHPEANVFTEKAEKMVSGIAAQAAVAMDNSRLLGALKASEEKYKKLASSQAFLARAGAILSSSLDFKKILAQLAQIAVPEIADWCSVYIKDPDGKIEVVATTHSDPERTQWISEFTKKYALNVNALQGPPNVIRTGQPEFISKVTEERVRKAGLSSQQWKTLKEMGLQSYICIPLRARDEVFGAISFTIAGSGRVYGKSDLKFTEDLARRASVAVDNAKLYAEAQAINRIKDEFLATLSHELRTPLNVILGHAEILKTEVGSLGKEVDFSIDAIYRNAKAQTRIISDLLDVSAIITGKISFNPSVLEIEGVVKAAVDSVRLTAQSKGIHLEFMPGPTPCKISGDPVRLQQMIWNLLSNAIKFTPKGGKIQVSTYSENSECLIEVSDTGKGIEPHFLPYVFDRFRQEDNSMTRKFGGLGLGLSIVRQLVEMHGGQITVKSEGKNRGSVFTIRLPIRAAVASEETPESKEKELKNKGLAGLEILIVDDEPDARHLLEKILTKAGAQVVRAASSQEALDQYRRKKPDLIVSDIGMPEEDGYSFLRRLRAVEASTGSYTPALALSAYAGDTEKDMSLAAGFQGHLAKPVESQNLISALSSLAHR